MLKRKRHKDKGKISFSRYFQELKKGDRVAVIREISVKFGYPQRLQGRTGVVIGKIGTAYDLEINDFNKPKRYIIKPIHLKKIED